MSDTDITALRAAFYEHMAFAPGDSDYVDTAWSFIEQQFAVAVPNDIYVQASTNFVRLQNKVKALPSRDELLSLLSSLLWERGNDVRVWPEDEAEAYRELGWSEGHAAARRLMLSKAANAIGSRLDVSL